MYGVRQTISPMQPIKIKMSIPLDSMVNGIPIRSPTEPGAGIFGEGVER